MQFACRKADSEFNFADEIRSFVPAPIGYLREASADFPGIWSASGQQNTSGSRHQIIASTV
jgi:hypothetical protein